MRKFVGFYVRVLLSFVIVLSLVALLIGVAHGFSVLLRQDIWEIFELAFALIPVFVLVITIAHFRDSGNGSESQQR